MRELKKSQQLIPKIGPIFRDSHFGSTGGWIQYE